jgi:hypothetical protein
MKRDSEPDDTLIRNGEIIVLRKKHGIPRAEPSQVYAWNYIRYPRSLQGTSKLAKIVGRKKRIELKVRGIQKICQTCTKSCKVLGAWRSSMVCFDFEAKKRRYHVKD